MGFMDFMGRMIEGKPVFEDEHSRKDGEPLPTDQTGESPVPEQAQPEGPAIRKGDDHSFPVVHIRRVSPRLDGAKMDVYAWIKNEWPQEIMLDKIRMLNTTRELDSFLRGGEERQFLVYSGPRPTHEYHEAELDYKTQQEGDYFRAIHDVEFQYHQDDKTYSVTGMDLRSPIRDIYG